MKNPPDDERCCPYCQARASSTARYCNQCGARLPKKITRREQVAPVCGACGQENLPGELFCAQCGIQLPPVAKPPPPPPVKF